MKTITNYFTQKSSDSSRGGALFAMVFGGYWYQHYKIFERLCKSYLLSDEDINDVTMRTLLAGALAFYDDATRSSSLSFDSLIQAFSAWYDSPTMREYNSKILLTISLSGTRGAEKDEHAALKVQNEIIELLAPIAAIRNRDSEAKSKILLCVVSGEK